MAESKRGRVSGLGSAGAAQRREPDLRGATLLGRFEAHVRSSCLLPRGARITVALSGGLDSVVLLDLLQRLSEPWNWQIDAAHFDHRMRRESGAEGDWVRDLCVRRGIPCRVGRSGQVPRNEGQARELRYEFLHKARSELGGEWLVTAHQADDQVETVLFRMLRGSGMAGLAGIPARRSPAIIRPLLPFWRTEIEGYARARRLAYLSDPSNQDILIARNWIRHRLIPELEAVEGPDVRRQLLRLSGLARRAEAAVSRRVERAAAGLILEASESRVEVARTRFRAYDNDVGGHLLRALAGRIGPRPGRAGTRLAIEFINKGSSGRRVELAGGVTLRREFDRLIIERRNAREPRGELELVIRDPRGGEAVARIGGRDWRVLWGARAVEGSADPSSEVACFELAALSFPLVVRGWRPGDRLRQPAGTRKLKRVFGDMRVGRSQRPCYPLVADQTGVLWVVGLVQGVRAMARDDATRFSIRCRREL